MRQKLITLDPTSWDLAAKKDNFSEWVRKQLRLEAGGHTLEAMEAEVALVYEQKEYWYQRYATAIKELAQQEVKE